MRRSKEDCNACFLPNCDCECKTCLDARERNSKLSPRELAFLCQDEIIKKEIKTKKE